MPDEPYYLPDDSDLAERAKAAIRGGDTDALTLLLSDHPELAIARLGDPGESRTLLHVATDWPGRYPNVGQSIAVLARAGADLDAPFDGGHTETPLHWAASSDDVDALDALLDAGANIEALGSVLGGGTPIADACGFRQWNVARRLVERGAKTRLRDAAALGLMDRVEAEFAGAAPPDAETITMSLWSAAHGCQRAATEYLLGRGGDLNWVGWGGKTPLDDAIDNEEPEFADWLRAHGATTAAELA